ncbi:leucine-rich repeat and calponin homology domain-containing protein 3-like [Notothenia coriiceps]|uniref:Leucine-rich repeat and calponin homology domain-containing protein 3-like n=1 Tax=Notothenia coriiceps TaxID=8208 RepID=A0A6I9PN35_9TELE|nr:PREDICTED: leucine-rich repeat and calponin homology domain-containing protein 3-like [Notothenia coriiceps]
MGVVESQLGYRHNGYFPQSGALPGGLVRSSFGCFSSAHYDLGDSPPPFNPCLSVCLPVCLPVCPQTVYPSRRCTHTDDSALFMGEDRAALSPTANQSPSYPSPGGVASCRTNQRPESVLFRLGQKEERRKGEASPLS